jgi:hypothetical protein
MSAPHDAQQAALLAAVLVLLACACAAGAGAQEPGTSIGGTVPSFLQLGIDLPPSLTGFAAASGTSTATLVATITATDAPVSLSVADGDSEAAPRHGHLVAGAGVLGDPLQAAAGGAAFQPLDAPLDPLLMRWTGALAARRAPIRLRQRVAGARPTAAKTLLITVSTETP